MVETGSASNSKKSLAIKQSRKMGSWREIRCQSGFWLVLNILVMFLC